MTMDTVSMVTYQLSHTVVILASGNLILVSVNVSSIHTVIASSK